MTKVIEFKDQIDEMSYDELVKLDNVIANKLILGSTLGQGSKITDAQVAGDLRVVAGQIQSQNYVLNTSGWKLTPTSGEFNFAVSVDVLDIPDTITAASFHVDNTGNMWSGATTFNIATNNFAVSSTGLIRAVSGTIGGCNLATDSIGSLNFSSGLLGSGWQIKSNGIAEFQDIIARGMIRTALFQKDAVSVVGGNFVVLDGDVLDADMTASDASALTTKGITTFAVGDILRIKDGTDDEWMEVSSTDATFYPDANPETTSVDGDVYRIEENASLSSLVSGVGTNAYPSATTMVLYLEAGTTNTYNSLSRCVLLFDTSFLPDDAEITSAKLGLYILASVDLFSGQTFNVVSSTPASNTNLVPGDYSQLGTAKFSSDINIGGQTTSAYLEISLNATGIAAINKGGITKLGLRLTCDGLGGSITWSEFSVAELDIDPSDSTNKPYLKIICDNTYSVTRDKASTYSANANPIWKKGATIVNYKQSGDGGVYMTASETNAPYLSIFDHAGSPWTTINTRLRIGNLNGYLGYNTDLYGIAIGETNKYLKYDPTNGLRLKADHCELDLGATSFIKGGQSDYNTGTGFFLGYSGSAYKFSIGDPSTNHLTWDGTNLEIAGTQTKTTAVVASNNLKASANTTNNETFDTYAKSKEISVNWGGIVRMYFEIYSQTRTTYGRIYVDGVAVGTERTAGSTWTGFTEDIAVSAGSLVQLYIHRIGGAGEGAECRNFRMSFDRTASNDTAVTLD